jgi:lysophospholipase L1-like esterase
MPTADSSHSSRRDFVLASAGLTAAGWAALSSQVFGAPADEGPVICPGNTILFQGDSITDVGRNRKEGDQPNHQPAMGGGYAWMAASQLLVSRPNDNLKIFNRGVSGNKVYQLDERWQEDCLDLKPNVLSILIGVNDVWHMLDGHYDGTLEKYETDYNDLLRRTKKALPDVKLVVCDPYVLRCGVINDKWFPVIDDYRAAAKRVADGAGAVFVPFQAMFNTAVKFAPPEHWAGDGVHPSPFGHALMAHTWQQVVGG